MLYGLVHLTLSDKDLLALHRRDIKYVRAIAKSPVHITREPSADLLQRIHCKPIQQVYHELQGRSLPTAVTSAASAPRLCRLSPQAVRGLQELQPGSRAFSCPTCGISFPSRHILKIHHSRKHGSKLGSSAVRGDEAYLDISQHCLEGLPRCKHCGASLNGWQEFRLHILNACPVLHDQPSKDIEALPDTSAPREEAGPAEQFAAGPQPLPLKERQDVLQQLLMSDWYQAAELPGVRDMLRHYCSFCGKWLSDRSGSLENHLRKAHIEIYQRQKDVRSMCRTVHLVRTSPCGVCSARFSKHTKHQCTMLQHSCYLRAVIGPSEHSAWPPLPCRTYRASGSGRSSSGQGGSALQVSSSSPEHLSRDGQGTGFALVLGGPSPGAGGSSDCSGRGDQHSGSARGTEGTRSSPARGQRQSGWGGQQGARGRRGWGNQGWSGYGRNGRQYDQGLEENVRLIARLCLRHEDELSQMRVERDFVLTMETQEAAVLAQLYRLSTVWKEKKEKGEVDCSLRMALFLGLCKVWVDRLQALDATTDEAKALRERIIELGQASVPEKQMELHWWYTKWDPSSSSLIKLADLEPLKQSQIIASLLELQTVITAPGWPRRTRGRR